MKSRTKSLVAHLAGIAITWYFMDIQSANWILKYLLPFIWFVFVISLIRWMEQPLIDNGVTGSTQSYDERNQNRGNWRGP